MYQNQVQLIGFLGKDAEMKTTKRDQSFTVLSLATKRIWKDKESGEYQSRTTWHRCLVWGNLSDFAATLKKGAHLQIEGAIHTREYTPKAKRGQAKETKSITEIRVSSIKKLDRPEKADTPSKQGEEAA